MRWLHGGEAEALAGSPWLGRGRSCGNDPEGIAGELGSGTAARGLPGRAAASSGSRREWEWVAMLQEAAEGGFYRRGGEEGSGSAGGHLSPAPGDEQC